MTPDSLVWIAAARARVAYHVPLERRTVCGLYVGPEGRERGWLLPVAEVVERFGSKACKRCAGTAEIVSPSCVPSRDRTWTS